MQYPDYYPLLDSFRSGYIDNRFFGLAFLFDSKGLLKSVGADNGAKFYLRSLFKPIQASILSDEIIKRFDFSDKELAVMQGSHSGEKVHTDAVKSILSKIGLSESYLLCPSIPPLNTINVNPPYTKIYNNCSGKHSMMLAYCVYYGLNTNNYTDYNHPCQCAIRNKLTDYAETCEHIATKDGCTVPVYGLTMEHIAKAFLNYYDDTSNIRLISAYKNNPYMAGGVDNVGMRTDTKIMGISPDLISKVGAGGFIYVYNKAIKQILIVKMSQDNNFAREIITLEFLYRLGWTSELHYDNRIFTEDGEAIGEYVLNGF